MIVPNGFVRFRNNLTQTTMIGQFFSPSIWIKKNNIQRYKSIDKNFTRCDIFPSFKEPPLTTPSTTLLVASTNENAFVDVKMGERVADRRKKEKNWPYTGTTQGINCQ